MITGIRKETLLRVARAATGKNNISKDALAEELGLSSMTVGRAVRELIKVGFIREERAELSRGRHAMLVSPSDVWVYLCILLSSDMMMLTAKTLSGDEVGSIKRPVDPSLTCRDNINVATRVLFEKYELENRITARGVLLLSGKNEFNGYDLRGETVYDAYELATLKIAKQFPEENLLYVSISGNYMRPLVLSHGNVFSRDGAKDIRVSNDVEKAERIVHLVSSLLTYANIDRVLIEGDMTEDASLLRLVKGTLTEKLKTGRKGLPCFEYYGNHSLTCSMLFDILKREHIAEVCDSLFVEQ